MFFEKIIFDIQYQIKCYVNIIIGLNKVIFFVFVWFKLFNNMKLVNKIFFSFFDDVEKRYNNEGFIFFVLYNFVKI